VSEIEKAPLFRNRVIVIVVPARGPAFTMFIHDTDKLALDALQHMVGGNIELVCDDNDGAVSIWMWEEARIYGQPINSAITTYVATTYGYPMVGNAIITGTDPVGNSIGLNHHQVEQLCKNGLEVNFYDLDWDAHHQLIGDLINA
jgi:hypothetical protein